MKLPLLDKLRAILENKDYKGLMENFFSLSGLQLVSYILPLITFPYLVRVLGPEKYGLIAFATAFIAYLQMITDYGFAYSATREISIHRDDPIKVSEIFSSVIFIKALLAVLSFALVLTVVSFVPQFKSDSLIYLFTFGLVIGYMLFPNWFFQGMEKMKFITILTIVSQVIFTVAIFIFIRSAADYLFVPLINSLGLIIAGILGLWVVFKNFDVKFKFPGFEAIKFQFREGWHVFVSTVAVNLYTNSSVFAVGLFTNNTLTGYYSIAEKLMKIVQTFPLASLLQTLYPRLAKIHMEDPYKAFKLSNKFQKLTTIGYLIVTPIMIFAAPWIVELIAGYPYGEIILAFRILLIAVFFININAFRVNYLLVSGRNDVFAKIHVGLEGILGTILVFSSVYALSYIGATIAITITELLVLIITIYYVSKLKKIDNL